MNMMMVFIMRTVKKAPDFGAQTKRLFFMNAIFAIFQLVKLASARSHEYRQQKDNQRQFRERRKQSRDLITVEIIVV